MAQTPLLECWHTWNAYHRQIPKDFPGKFANKTAINKFHRQIKVGWKKLSVEHPITHGRRKRQFHMAVKRLRFVTQQYLRASERLQAEIDGGVLGEPETHEHLLNAQIVKLKVPEKLIRTEHEDLGPPADLIRGYDNDRVTNLRTEFQITAAQAARARRMHEKDIDDRADEEGTARKRYGPRDQQRVQQRNVDRRAGGNMYYRHLYTSYQTTAGVWILSDAHNNVVEKVAVKDAYFLKYFDYDWTNRALWFGDVHDPTRKVPWEVRIHEKLLDPSILHLRGWNRAI
jgi:hypothetical protein